MADPGALAFVRTVRVGTENAAKLEAVRAALAPYVADLTVEGVAALSGVPEQPVGFAQIVAGARNRARAAFASGPCELAIGIEDGLVEIDGVEPDAAAVAVLNIGAAVVTDGHREAFGLSSGFAYPEQCSAPALRDRAPIGELFDELWRARSISTGSDTPDPAATPSGRGAGNIGMLSQGVLRRSEYGRHAVLCALVRFLHPDLYFAGDPPAAPLDRTSAPRSQESPP